ncbi:hypothetical protein [Kitasatospora sp. DSM 101779]|uniref:hypothetical protein n=1 Tax=Kitasatospora sp. DSM 101779 TaxID=2853165 RepID=UPI0021D84140|nr:hypothetical protein [Kitasatospora sp. DSM 101779]MCU7827325.1 hypothetical protein [Kitasatospora sp. DSM 101779]MCU7827404.1 hypothetical protein [Kitasatospora sp. DSM 101779]
MSGTARPPAWRRKQAEKRSEQRARRVGAHVAQLRSEAAAGGPPAAAAAEWNILRSVIGRLPEGARDGEWMQLAAVLRQLSEALAKRHSK